ncbi:unnamed protein product [Plutella xylostella]|uniref:unspecific monooxygenase n=1 Tax=Plutella xylostella TaxID=51655 RepID=A0A8S4E172_PLUXY|nr:unnamed protein product [Plutella xylostella]
MLLAIILLLVIFIITFSFLLGSYNESYWAKRNVKYHGGKNAIATFSEFLFTSRGIFDIFGDIYKLYPEEPAVATPSLLQPALFVKHPENIQHVLTDNFKNFYHRGVEIAKKDKLAQNVLFLNGSRWKLMRQKMTPLFTSAKLKNMHYIIDRCAQDYIGYLKEHVNDKNANAFETLSVYSCSSLLAPIFGIHSGQSTVTSPLLNMARNATKPTLKANLKFILNSLSPKVFQMLGLSFFGEYEEQFIGAISQVIRQRKEENVKKHDFADIAVSLQNAGTMKDESSGCEIEPTDEVLAAQAFFFLIAGVDPVTMGIYGTLFELAKRPDILKQVQQEIDGVFENNTEIGYDVIGTMEYLTKVLEESLRLHPPISLLSRECMGESILPVGNIRVSKGTRIDIPILAIHHDPKYYPDPDVFDPERFSAENKNSRPNMTFMPFGEGGRLCIGQRFAYLQMKTGLAHILRNFTVKVDDVTKKMTYLKSSLIIRPANDINFTFVPRNKE